MFPSIGRRKTVQGYTKTSPYIEYLPYASVHIALNLMQRRDCTGHRS